MPAGKLPPPVNLYPQAEKNIKKITIIRIVFLFKNNIFLYTLNPFTVGSSPPPVPIQSGRAGFTEKPIMAMNCLNRHIHQQAKQ